MEQWLTLRGDSLNDPLDNGQRACFHFARYMFITKHHALLPLLIHSSNHRMFLSPQQQWIFQQTQHFPSEWWLELIYWLLQTVKREIITLYIYIFLCSVINGWTVAKIFKHSNFFLRITTIIKYINTRIRLSRTERKRHTFAIKSTTIFKSKLKSSSVSAKKKKYAINIYKVKRIVQILCKIIIKERLI